MLREGENRDPQGSLLLPDISFVAGRTRYVAGDGALPQGGAYSRRPNNNGGNNANDDIDYNDLDSFSQNRFNRALPQQAPVLPPMRGGM